MQPQTVTSAPAHAAGEGLRPPAVGLDDERVARAWPFFDKRRPIGRALRLLAVASVIGAAFGLGIPLCPFAIFTRHPCPGCGLTRATFALLRGHVEEAVHFHPLVFLVTPVVAVAFTYNAITYVRRGDWFASERVSGKWVNRAWIALGVLMIGVWIARFFGAFGGPVAV